jgi:hypothetical protein
MQTKLCLPTCSTEIAQIPLNNGLFAIIDATDFFELSKFHWTSRRSHSNIYAIRKVHKGKIYRTIFMHRQLLHVNSEIEVHHLNHNTLDNRRSNLEPLNPTLHRLQHTLDRIQKMPIDFENKHR